jgi:hypothetical protein
MRDVGHDYLSFSNKEESNRLSKVLKNERVTRTIPVGD